MSVTSVPFLNVEQEGSSGVTLPPSQGLLTTVSFLSPQAHIRAGTTSGVKIPAVTAKMTAKQSSWLRAIALMGLSSCWTCFVRLDAQLYNNCSRDWPRCGVRQGPHVRHNRVFTETIGWQSLTRRTWKPHTRAWPF